MNNHEPMQQPAAQALSFTWEASASRHTKGETLRLGKYVVGSWCIDATLPAGSKAIYAVTCKLPGIRAEVGHCENAHKSRELLQKVVKTWVAGAGLIETPAEATTQTEGASA